MQFDYSGVPRHDGAALTSTARRASGISSSTMSRPRRLDFNSSFIVEHHFTGFGQVSASLNLLTWIGARTKTLRLGTAVLVLPWHNPVLLAEQASTLDLLSGGRFDFGIGKGYRYNEFAGFCVPMEEAEPRFDEVLEVMIKAWTSDTPWSHRGQYWQFDNIVVEPPTVQKPHPPIWMGAGSPGPSKKWRPTASICCWANFSPWPRSLSKSLSSSQRSRPRAHIRPDDRGSRSLNVVMNAAEYEKAIENRMAGRRRVERLSQRPDAQNQKKVMSEDEVREVAEAGTLYGTPDDVAVKLQALRDVGAAYVLINSAGGPASLRRFAREVMPAFLG